MAELSKAEKKALTKAWKELHSRDYLLTEENVQELFEFLENQMDNFGCDHTLRHTEQWIKENIPQEMVERVLAEIRDMGGYCDCEVLLNCYEDYDML